MSSIVNLTPHVLTVVVEDADGDHQVVIGRGPVARDAMVSIVLTIQPRLNEQTGRPLPASAREVTAEAEAVNIEGISVPTMSRRFGAPTDLPEPTEGMLLFVSALTLSAATSAGRSTHDLLTPGEMASKDGKPFGVLSFARQG